MSTSPLRRLAGTAISMCNHLCECVYAGGSCECNLFPVVVFYLRLVLAVVAVHVADRLLVSSRSRGILAANRPLSCLFSASVLKARSRC